MRKLFWLFGFGLTAGLLLFGRIAHAQQDPSCNDWQVNAQGSSNADITIDSTSGGVSVLAATSKSVRCAAIIRNTGSAAMRCGPASGSHAITVTTTAGQLVNAGETLVVGFEGWPSVKCIRTTANSTTANVGEVGKGGR